MGDKARILYAKGANVTQDKGIIDYLNEYEPAVAFDTRSPQADDRRSGTGGEQGRRGGGGGGGIAGHGA
ncbi:Periplasmic beta-glucosidase precursor [Serratia marcescens]|uniref:Periplasmic beta-glucosidase n=1 Tax=Serratia marcescens TaxID=615 RepID=A0A380AIC9_SERMA|nr:Periplasmic beta-glucosidase precursor [Serratia marcescens]